MKLKNLLSTFLSFNFFNLYGEQKLVGKQAPIFASKALFPDGSTGELHLRDYFGKNIVVYFYPMDNSSYCTIQAKNFRDNIDRLKNNDIIIIGISPDTITSHLKFQKEHSLNYPLISDAGNKNSIAKKYNASGFLYGKRKTFLINKKGIIFKEFDKVDIENQTDQIINCFELES
jgi:peroxiredoxin Q/BCP